MSGGKEDYAVVQTGQQSHVVDELREIEQQIETLRAELAVKTSQDKVDAEEAAALKQAAAAPVANVAAQAEFKRLIVDTTEEKEKATVTGKGPEIVDIHGPAPITRETLCTFFRNNADASKIDNVDHLLENFTPQEIFEALETKYGSTIVASSFRVGKETSSNESSFGEKAQQMKSAGESLPATSTTASSDQMQTISRAQSTQQADSSAQPSSAGESLPAMSTTAPSDQMQTTSPAQSTQRADSSAQPSQKVAPASLHSVPTSLHAVAAPTTPQDSVSVRNAAPVTRDSDNSQFVQPSTTRCMCCDRKTAVLFLVGVNFLFAAFAIAIIALGAYIVSSDYVVFFDMTYIMCALVFGCFVLLVSIGGCATALKMKRRWLKIYLSFTGIICVLQILSAVFVLQLMLAIEDAEKQNFDIEDLHASKLAFVNSIQSSVRDVFEGSQCVTCIANGCPNSNSTISIDCARDDATWFEDFVQNNCNTDFADNSAWDRCTARYTLAYGPVFCSCRESLVRWMNSKAEAIFGITVVLVLMEALLMVCTSNLLLSKSGKRLRQQRKKTSSRKLGELVLKRQNGTGPAVLIESNFRPGEQLMLRISAGRLSVFNQQECVAQWPGSSISQVQDGDDGGLSIEFKSGGDKLFAFQFSQTGSRAHDLREIWRKYINRLVQEAAQQDVAALTNTRVQV